MIQILVPTLFGAVLFLIGLMHFRKVRASASWPYTPGRIISAKVDRSITRGGQDEADSVSFTPIIQYEYFVDNQRYLGDRIGFIGQSYSRQKQAEEAMQAFPVGASVWVFYNPAKPGKAVLERKASGGTMLMVAGGVILLLAIVVAVKSMK